MDMTQIIKLRNFLPPVGLSSNMPMKLLALYVRSRVKPRFFELNICTSGLTAVYTDYVRREGPIIAIPYSGYRPSAPTMIHKRKSD